MIVVLGCGNLNRCDDGVGPEIVRMLRQRAADRYGPDIRLIDVGTDGMAAMFAARGCRTLIVADASRSGSEPGAVFEVPGDQFEQRYEPTLSLHDFRWDHALYAGRRIFRDAFPDDVNVFLIEVGSTELGIGLSPKVAAAADLVAARIEGLIRDRVQGRAAT